MSLHEYHLVVTFEHKDVKAILNATIVPQQYINLSRKYLMKL